METVIENWFVLKTPGGVNVDGFFRPTVYGYVFNHPDFPDGSEIETSSVVEANSFRIGTKSGSVYVLGQPDKGYADHLQNKGVLFDPANPLKLRGYL